MSEHTALPWVVRDRSGPEFDVYIGPADNKFFACARAQGFNGPEARANAALIVRAVNAHADLLAACERAAAILRPEVEPMTFERQATHSLLCAALEKARGA